MLSCVSFLTSFSWLLPLWFILDSHAKSHHLLPGFTYCLASGEKAMAPQLSTYSVIWINRASTVGPDMLWHKYKYVRYELMENKTKLATNKYTLATPNICHILLAASGCPRNDCRQYYQKWDYNRDCQQNMSIPIIHIDRLIVLAAYIVLRIVIHVMPSFREMLFYTQLPHVYYN